MQKLADTMTLPSAPSRPVILNVTDTSVELEWSPPEIEGATPIIGYIIQYWSPNLKEVIYFFII